MGIKVHTLPALTGEYALLRLDVLTLDRATRGQLGICRIAAGTRSPPEGFRTSGRHEVAFLLSGRIRVETPGGETHEVQAPSALVASPAEPHATVGIHDAELFYVLIDDQ